MDYNNMDIVMIGSDQAVPDEKKPALPIKIVDKDEKKNHFRIKILHPNKDKEGNREVLYDQVHRVSPETDDLMEGFNLAQAKAQEIIDTKFADLETKHEEILYIPAARTGKMKLKKKPGTKGRTSRGKVAKKTAKKVSKKKATKKKVTKKSTKKKVSTKKKKSKKAVKKKVAKKISKKVAKKKATKKKATKKKTVKKNAKKTTRRKKKK